MDGGHASVGRESLVQDLRAFGLEGGPDAIQEPSVDRALWFRLPTETIFITRSLDAIAGSGDARIEIKQVVTNLPATSPARARPKKLRIF